MGDKQIQLLLGILFFPLASNAPTNLMCHTDDALAIARLRLIGVA